MAALSESRFVMSASSRIDAMKPVMRRLVCRAAEPSRALPHEPFGQPGARSLPDLGAVAGSRRHGRRRCARGAGAVVGNAARDLGQAFRRLEPARTLPLLAADALTNHAVDAPPRTPRPLTLRRLRDRGELARHPLDRLDERPAQVGVWTAVASWLGNVVIRHDVLAAVAVLLVVLDLQRPRPDRRT